MFGFIARLRAQRVAIAAPVASPRPHVTLGGHVASQPLWCGCASDRCEHTR